MKTTTDKRTEIKQKKKQVPESCEWEKQDDDDDCSQTNAAILETSSGLQEKDNKQASPGYIRSSFIVSLIMMSFDDFLHETYGRTDLRMDG